MKRLVTECDTLDEFFDLYHLSNLIFFDICNKKIKIFLILTNLSLASQFYNIMEEGLHEQNKLYHTS